MPEGPTRQEMFSGKIIAIDALRGYAIILVLLSHTLIHIPDLVWPAKRLLMIGVYGVQLFFVASALTLMISWAKDRGSFIQKSSRFFVRRFFRIAPLYYLAVPSYIIIFQVDFFSLNFSTLFATLFFYNAWIPGFTYPQNGWAPVPGGWSISVEFAFYLIFPFLMLLVRKMAYAALLFALSVFVMVLMRYFSWHAEIGNEPENISLFLYYSPFNQISVFSLGVLLYWSIKNEVIQRLIYTSKITADIASIVMFLFLIVISYYGQHKFFNISRHFMPTHLMISIAFAIWSAVLIIKPGGFVLNRLITQIGRVSFGIYLVHFASLHLVSKGLQYCGWENKVGLYGLAYFVFLTSFSLTLSYLSATVLYRYVEEPFLNLGHQLSILIGSKSSAKVSNEKIVSRAN
jgi:peptidoglycan/LPS O-acetylase OafA/YrhL